MKAVRIFCIAAALGTMLSVAGGAQSYEPYDCAWSSLIRESTSAYVCPAGKVMAGRVHYGDENGNTQYNCCRVRPVGGSVDVSTSNYSPWQGPFKESSGINVFCSSNQVMVGRAHNGDENGSSYYQCCSLDDAGLPLLIKTSTCAWSSGIRESAGFAYTCPWPKVMVGRAHYGDENGTTYYHCCEVW